MLRFKMMTIGKVCGLQLVTSNGEVLFFSSNHIPCPYISKDAVGISQSYAKTLKFEENDVVVITPIYNIGSIQSVNVTPKSEDDYEILHSSSLVVESSLLSQVRVVWPNQEFPVWVSENISVILSVDSISPNLKYGRLEEYSEISVADVPKDNKSRTLFSFSQNDTAKEESKILSSLKENIPQSKFIKFRCVSSKKVPLLYSKLNTHPYVVFADKESLPEWAQKAISSDKTVVWRMKKIGEGQRSCVVTLSIFEGKYLIHINRFRTLVISYALRHQLGLENGSRVSLELMKKESSPDIQGILVSSSFQSKDSETVLKFNIREAFKRATLTHSDLLLNTKGEYPIEDKYVVITLRPLHLEWGFINNNQLKDLSIDINEFVSQNAFSDNGNLHGEQEEWGTAIPCFEKLKEQGKLALQLSLSLMPNKKCRRFCDNLLYVGRSGCGKTSIVKYLLQTLEQPPFYVFSRTLKCGSLKGKRVEVLSKFLIETLHTCALHEPSVLFLDDLDLLAGVLDDNSEAAFHMSRVAHKLSELIESFESTHYFTVLATAKSVDNVNSKLISKKGKSLFSSVINISDLVKADRLHLLKSLILKSQSKGDVVEVDAIASKTDGYTPLDLKKLFEKAVFEAIQRKTRIDDKYILTNEDFQTALKTSKPASVQQVSFYKGDTSSLVNVGGLEEVKEKLMEVVCWPTMFPEIMRQCPVKPQTGILLYGAPGTGKTLLASALAGESQMNFIAIKGPEIMSKYIGESEEGVRKLFEKAQMAKPCLLFFDEFDSLAPRRGQDQTGVTDRVVNQLLTALDGVDPMSGVWVIAATSRPDLIDPAVLRPGRIGISMFCPLPDKSDRLAILQVLCKKVPLSDDVSLEVIAALTDGYTGADLRGILTTGQINILDSLRNDDFLMDEVSLDNNIKPVELSREVVMHVLNEMKPSLTKSERLRYDMIYQKFDKRIPLDLKEQKVTHA